MRLCLVALLAIATSAHADPASKARADKLFEDGRKYLAAKEYALACTAFEQSQVADPAIGTELNIALCYEQWGKVASAYRAYVEAARLADAKRDNRAKGAHQKIDELDAKAPRLALELGADADPSAVILVDGKEVERAHLADDAMLDPGPHEVEVRVPGVPAKRIAVELALRDRKRIPIDAAPAKPVVTVVLPPPPAQRTTTTSRSAPRLYGGIALAAGGAVLTGVAAVVALGARSDYNAAVAGCPALACTTRADYDATRSARSRANYMTFVGAGGLALAGVGVYLMATSRIEMRGVAIAPLLGEDRVGIALGGAL